MKFLTLNDLQLTIEVENLNEITNDNDALLDLAEQTAIEETKDNLRKSYDIDFELRPYVLYDENETYEDKQRVLVVTENTSGGVDTYDVKVINIAEDLTVTLSEDDRNASLKYMIINLFKMIIFQRVAPRQLSESVINTYNMTIDKLHRASQGKIELDLKLSEPLTDNNSSFRWGTSEISKKNRF
jgi:hypothetical protein